MSAHFIEELINPRSIAVVGASAGSGGGMGFFQTIRESGFKGSLYPVNPKYDEIQGLTCYPTVTDIPGDVDYVISSIPASGVLDMISDCAQKGVKLIHLFTARFSETGRKEAVELEQEILRQAEKAGIRLIGPNCMGLFYPEAGISFHDRLPMTSGSAGLISQSGSIVLDIVELAQKNGIQLSKAISYGNALDLNECDFLEYFVEDPKTKIILMYVEGLKDGKTFFERLRHATSVKPVIIIKGGRGESGTRATASHTASLAGSMNMWRMAVKQAGAVSARHPEELVDIATAFHYLPKVEGRRIGVAGGAGGSSVLAADLCEEAGLDVIPFPQDLREMLKAGGSEIWDWISNPVDRSIRVDRTQDTGDFLKIMAGHPDFDLLMTFIHFHSNKDGQKHSAKQLLEAYCLDDLMGKPLLAVMEDQVEGDTLMEEAKRELETAKVPVFLSTERAALAARKLIDYYQHQKQKL